MQSARGKVCAPVIFYAPPVLVPIVFSVVSPHVHVLHVPPSLLASCVAVVPPLPSSLLPHHPALQGFQILHEGSMIWQTLIKHMNYLYTMGLSCM